MCVSVRYFLIHHVPLCLTPILYHFRPLLNRYCAFSAIPLHPHHGRFCAFLSTIMVDFAKLRLRTLIVHVTVSSALLGRCKGRERVLSPLYLTAPQYALFLFFSYWVTDSVTWEALFGGNLVGGVTPASSPIPGTPSPGSVQIVHFSRWNPPKQAGVHAFSDAMHPHYEKKCNVLFCMGMVYPYLLE